MNSSDPHMPNNKTQTFTWKNGRQWFEQGVMTFKAIKAYWYMATLALMMVAAVLMNLAPVVVSLIMIILSPVLTAFIMVLCQQLNTQQPLSAAVAWSAVTGTMNNLLLLGVLAALLSVVFQLIHNQLILLLGLPLEVTEEMVQQMTGKEAMTRVLVAMLTNLPVALALAFSPILVLLQGQLPWAAMRQSVAAVLTAWRAFLALTVMFILLTFGIIVLASLMISILLMVMGGASALIINLIIMFGMITLLGVGLCAQFHAYLELFTGPGEAGDSADGTEIYTEI
jgi:hypothetical protein